MSDLRSLTAWSTLTRRAAVLCAASLLPLASAWAADTASVAPQVQFKTSMGDFTIEVYTDKAPKTAENFLQYVKDKHYDGTIFHRVIDNFMVQGGGYTLSKEERKTRAPIALEAQTGLKNEVGTVAMARTGYPHSATAQFFVNVKNNDFLNARGASDGYAVFGKVVSGMDVVNKIKVVPTSSGDAPKEPVVIQSATLVKSVK
ncbi:MAG: hypothetical protein RIR79_894 [Pseudomonadota bacterium]|jgi:cyclophilin family peptidyl-prolyl cis-trans isomerase